MINKYFYKTLVIVMLYNTMYSQKKLYKIHTVAFYNLENLFDTENDPNKLDEYSPIMEIKANKKEVYHNKINNMAKVILDIGQDISHNSPAIIGVAEVENKTVLENLTDHNLLKDKNYKIVHYNSPDVRGIDVALLYQDKLFKLLSKSTHTLKLYNNTTNKRIHTRDQLLVSGFLDDELIHVIVNHWPSRRGGEAKSKPKRIAAAKLSKRIIDSLQVINPYAKILLMGDLNDNPTNRSIKKILHAKKNKQTVKSKELYNPMELFYKNGIGSNAYRDRWSLFDQILLSKPFVNQQYSTYQFYKASIVNKSYLLHKKGRYKGYPFRSFSNNKFTNGYSDHLPVCIYLIKQQP